MGNSSADLDPAPSEIENLAQEARNVLEQNWTGSFTRPAPAQYPHQWSWDAVFVAIGYAHYNQKRAQQELRRLFSGQWENGMVPHIVFNEKEEPVTYFPGPDFWQTERCPYAPEKPQTSGICQPPIHATGLRHLLRYAADRQQVVDFAGELFPKLKAWHTFLYRERDAGNEGLVYIRHPWESGQDNSPIWSKILKRTEVKPEQIPDYERRDTDRVDPAERPADEDYDKFVYLLNFSREREYLEKKIREDDCPFLVQDVLFNTLLCKANRDLAEVADIIGKDPEPFNTWADQTARVMNSKLWYGEEQMYADYDLQAKQKVQGRVLSGFLPLLAGIPDEDQKHQMFEYLNTHCFCQMTDTCFPAPSYDRSGEDYSARLYWRGPVWINMNWLLGLGLERYGYYDYANKIKDSMIQLPLTSGFREYFDTDNGKGYGTEDFSWTASLLLDVLYRRGDLPET